MVDIFHFPAPEKGQAVTAINKSAYHSAGANVYEGITQTYLPLNLDPAWRACAHTVSDILVAFIAAMYGEQLIPSIPIDGMLGRNLIQFHCMGDPPGTQNGYAILHYDTWVGGVFGHLRRNTRTWWAPVGLKAPANTRNSFLSELQKLEIIPQVSISIQATPFTWLDPTDIPPREWLYGEHFIRHYLSTTLAPGGVGKSSLLLTEALAMVSGKQLLGGKSNPRLRVWYWNGEDPLDELHRKVMATALHYSLAEEDLSGLFLGSGREVGLQLATSSREGVKIVTPTVNALTRTLVDRQIDVLIVDPFVTTHTVNENDNAAMQAVIRKFADIAQDADCSIELVHHTRKTSGNDVTVEDGRGASAMLAAVRSARVINRMTKPESDRFGVDNPRQFFRTENGKANLRLPADKADWFQLVSVPLGNGDYVGVVSSWEPPDPFEDLTSRDLFNAQTEVAKGGPWRRDRQSPDWVGHPIARALGWDLGRRGYKSQLEAILKVWISKGAFEEYTDIVPRRREEKKFVRVGQLAVVQ